MAGLKVVNIKDVKGERKDPPRYLVDSGLRKDGRGAKPGDGRQ